MNAISPGLVVGLVNNMPGNARRAADAQFTALLQAPGIAVRLRRFAPETDGTDGYEPIEALWHAPIDGLVVTGAEPRANRIEHEPSWPLLARLVDWAANRTRSAIWSCLAAHAAVYRLDHLHRRRLDEKLSGLFPCAKTATHPLLDGAPASWTVPHSRVNDLDAEALERLGYTVLSRCEAGQGADAFAKQVSDSHFLMLQGHPEYTADTLLREYRRDVRHYLEGNRTDWPRLPQAYFDPATQAALLRHAGTEHALAALDAAPLPSPAWQAQSVRLFNAWIAGLATGQTARADWSVR